MYRNPCLHQGDIRVVTAVDRPQLAFLINVVVLPSATNVPSLAAACSGGDLDGDMFSLIWDERLVPPKNNVFAPLDYDNIAAEATTAVPSEGRTCSLAQFYTKVMANDLLGRVAHLHLALCDLLPDGAKDPLALELAKSQSLAVDFPKTGVAPKVPEDALKLIADQGFPDFMEKPQNVSYMSKKLLGSLFRRCLSLPADTLDLIETFTVQPPQRAEAGVEEAERLYAMYVVAMRRLMSRFGLKCEAEVVLGEAVHWHPLHSANRGKASAALKSSWDAIRCFFREEFSSGGDPVEKARIWYKVAYSKQPRSQAFLSFAWLTGSMEFMSLVPQTLSVYSIVGGSALKYYLSTISARRITILGLLEKFEIIKEELRGQFEVSLFGSAALFLCDADSDIDIFIQPPLSWESQEGLARLTTQERQKYFLELLIPSLDTLGRTIRRVYNTPTPVIKCTVLDEELETNVDFSVCADGIWKAKFITAQYRARPEVLPVFSLIFEWAKACGVLRSSGIGSECLLCGGELHAIILKTFNMNAPCSHLQEPLLYDDICSAALDGETIGSMIFFFFKECANCTEDFEFVWPVESSPRHFILADKCKQLATECRRMLHAIAVSYTWKEAVEYCSLKAKSDFPMEQLLSRSLSYHLERAIEFHASRLSLVTGAEVNLQMKDARVLVSANGSRLQLRKLREELRRLLRVGHSIGHLRHRVSAYFMEGSTNLFMLGITSASGSLKFEVYKEGCQRIHAFHDRSQVEPLHGSDSEYEQSSWTRYFIFEFQKRSFLQLEALRGHPNASTLWMSVHFGNFYAMNAVAAVSGRLGALSLGELETAISANRRSRRRLEERVAWDQDGVERQRETRELKKTTIPTAGGAVTLSKEDGSIFRQKTRNRKISSSFYPCVAVRTLFAERMEAVEQFLLRFGFVRKTDMAGDHHPHVKYKVDMIASNSFMVEIKLDSNLRLITIGEKPLQWVHCTLLRGPRVSNPDIRIKISTTSEVPESSDLFRFAFPNGTDDPPISVDSDSGCVRPSLNLPANVRERVHFVRQIDRKVQFVIDGGVVASVACGVHYSGRLLEHSEPFCDLSLEVLPVPLREWCSFHETDAALSQWMTKVLSTVLAVSEALSAL